MFIHSVLTGLCYCPHPILDLGINGERVTCVGTAASGLTFDQVEPCASVSQCNQGETILLILPLFPHLSFSDHIFSASQPLKSTCLVLGD